MNLKSRDNGSVCTTMVEKSLHNNGRDLKNIEWSQTEKIE